MIKKNKICKIKVHEWLKERKLKVKIIWERREHEGKEKESVSWTMSPQQCTASASGKSRLVIVLIGWRVDCNATRYVSLRWFSALLLFKSCCCFDCVFFILHLFCVTCTTSAAWLKNSHSWWSALGFFFWFLVSLIKQIWPVCCCSITPYWAACLQTSTTSSCRPFRPALSRSRSDKSLRVCI